MFNEGDEVLLDGEQSHYCKDWFERNCIWLLRSQEDIHGGMLLMI